MNKQIAFAIRILKSSHIPTFDGFTIIEQRSLQFVFPINCFASSVTDIRVFISQIIGMHIHNIFPGRRAFHHFHPLAYTVRSQYTIGLHRQHHSFKFPVNQIIGRVATESREGITLIRFILSEQVIPPTIFHNACTMCIDNIPLFVEPRYAVINYFSRVGGYIYFRIMMTYIRRQFRHNFDNCFHRNPGYHLSTINVQMGVINLPLRTEIIFPGGYPHEKAF